jgi:hypothetical protein
MDKDEIVKYVENRIYEFQQNKKYLKGTSATYWVLSGGEAVMLDLLEFINGDNKGE